MTLHTPSRTALFCRQSSVAAPSPTTRERHGYHSRANSVIDINRLYRCNMMQGRDVATRNKKMRPATVLFTDPTAFICRERTISLFLLLIYEALSFEEPYRTFLSGTPYCLMNLSTGAAVFRRKHRADLSGEPQSLVGKTAFFHHRVSGNNL